MWRGDRMAGWDVFLRRLLLVECKALDVSAQNLSLSLSPFLSPPLRLLPYHITKVQKITFFCSAFTPFLASLRTRPCTRPVRHYLQGVFPSLSSFPCMPPILRPSPSSLSSKCSSSSSLPAGYTSYFLSFQYFVFSSFSFTTFKTFLPLACLSLLVISRPSSLLSPSSSLLFLHHLQIVSRSLLFLLVIHSSSIHVSPSSFLFSTSSPTPPLPLVFSLHLMVIISEAGSSPLFRNS